MKKLDFKFDYGFESISVPTGDVTIEEADYAEIDEINAFLSKEIDIDRYEDALAMLSARDIYAG